MIRCFRKSIVVVAAIAAVALILEIYVLFIKDFILVWTRPLAAMMIAVIGLLAARIAGNLTASAANTGLLGILFHDMDPDRFIEAYGSVAGRTRKGSFDSFSSYAYLADGYSASGKPERALEIIDKAYSEAKDKDKLLPYYRTNRIRYLLASGLYGQADDELARLLDDISGRDPALKANIGKATLPMKEFLDTYLRGNPDYSSLVDEMNYSKVLTSKLEAASLVRVLRERNGESTKDADRIIELYPKYRGGIDQSKR